MKPETDTRTFELRVRVESATEFGGARRRDERDDTTLLTKLEFTEWVFVRIDVDMGVGEFHSMTFLTAEAAVSEDGERVHGTAGPASDHQRSDGEQKVPPLQPDRRLGEFIEIQIVEELHPHEYERDLVDRKV